jgi:spermidine/putrescine transport system permease protein
VAFGAFATTAPAGDAGGSAGGRRRRSLVALALLLPGVLYLALTFVEPFIALILTSLKAPSGLFDGNYVWAFRWENYAEAFDQFGAILVRTLGFSLLATLLALVIGYPLAYFIGVTLRRFPLWQSLALVLVIAPFFISFLLRTFAWKQVLADEGPVVHVLQALSLMPPDGRLTGTAFSVVFGLTYNFIPFMVLPIYASLERLDLRYVEAGSDLYAGPVQRFVRIVWPLSLPGVVSGTLLTFIPASGDYVNASNDFLGNPGVSMAGNAINSTYLATLYPISAALSIVLMVAILIPVAAYVARTGSDDLL